MLVRDLIKELEALIERNKSMEDMLGEAVIMFDYYKDYGDGSLDSRYAGIVPDAYVDYTSDGVYPVLIAISDKEKAMIAERKKKLDKQE